MSSLNIRQVVWVCSACVGLVCAHVATAQAPAAPAPNKAPAGTTAPARESTQPSKARADKSRLEPAPAPAQRPAAPESKPGASAGDDTKPPSAAAPPAAQAKPVCTLADAEQPRGGRLEILAERFGSSPVVRIAGKPARMLERRPERISIQIPADSDGGEITLAQDGRVSSCGTLVIIGKNR